MLTELAILFFPNLPFSYVMMMPFKRQALVEFENIDSAKECVTFAADEPVYIAGQQAFFNYSTSKRITRPGNTDDPSGGNKVLLLSIQNPLYPITVVCILVIQTKLRMRNLFFFSFSPAFRAYGSSWARLESKSQLQQRCIFNPLCKNSTKLEIILEFAVSDQPVVFVIAIYLYENSEFLKKNYYYFLLFFLGLPPWHMEVPRVGVDAGLHHSHCNSESKPRL